MLVDGNIGETTDRTKGADLAGVHAETAAAERIGYDGLWTTETRHDPFLPLLTVAERSSRMQVGTAIAVAFARNPMTTAMVANDLQSLSGGRFILGLGSQVKAHIERRFSMPWSSPAARMREYVAAVRAIWQSWHEDTRLDFRGDFYQHTLMTPMFSPGPNPYGPPPVLIAAVGPQMTATAAQVADGMLVHGFTSERYLREVTLPQVDATLQEAGKDRWSPRRTTSGPSSWPSRRYANGSRSTVRRRPTAAYSTCTVGGNCRASCCGCPNSSAGTPWPG